MKKTALITGASSGIGMELAKIHAEKHGDLVIIARSGDKLIHLKEILEKEHKIEVYVIEKDLTKPNAVKEIYDEVSQNNIQIEYLINNAGFGGVGRFDERKLETDLSMIDLNVRALTEMTHYFLQDFVRRNQGKILNVSSTASLMPGPLQAVYFATKSFVSSFSNAIAEELSDTNITVTNLMPGATETNFGQVSGMDKTEMFKNTASARTVAEDGYNGMIDGKMDVTSGLSISQKIMTSIIPMIPKKALLKQIKKMQDVD